MSPDVPIVIAEAGVNHNGDLDKALSLVDAAADAGAEIVKFQTFDPLELTTAGASLAAYQKNPIDRTTNQRALLSALQLTPEMHSDLLQYCSQKDIEFLSTAFDINSLNDLLKLGIKRIKVPSGELTNLPFIEEVARAGLPVILSTGMATMRETQASVEAMVRKGLSIGDLTILHCTSDYPAPLHSLNMCNITEIRRILGTAVGYSDHSLGNEAAIIAVALGATVIEKHITIDRLLPGPDHKASLEPEQFSNFVKSIKDASTALGVYGKFPSETELLNAQVVRKSIVASQKIKKGQIFTLDNITTKRPAGGISPMEWYDVLGKVAIKDFDLDDFIEV